MLFNSYEYLFLFLPASVIVFFLLNRWKATVAAKGSLVFFSLFFYCWWKPELLPVILVSILFNFMVGSLLLSPATQKRRSLLLAAGIAGNLVALGFFKYTDFFIVNINLVTGAAIPLQRVVLPLGISFFTFTQIAYLVDVSQGKVKELNLLNYVLFVTYFPHLLAGPILHHKEMMPQFDRLRNKVVSYKNLYVGLCLFSTGMFKKAVLADNLAVAANPWLDAPAALDTALAWLVSVAYSLQLYFDFSGYTDMAIGSALMMNIRLPQNFNSPYKATDIQDFWRRWHMTLSRFLRDYVYIPLGGSRNGKGRMLSNLFVTFLLGGIWHGAGWTFVVWGGLHGLATVVHRVWNGTGRAMPRFLGWLLTFLFVNTTWVFFRAASMGNAMTMLNKMYLPGADPLRVAARALTLNYRLEVFVLAGGGVALFLRNSTVVMRDVTPRFAVSLVAAVALIFAMMNMNVSSPFLYFNF